MCEEEDGKSKKVDSRIYFQYILLIFLVLMFIAVWRDHTISDTWFFHEITGAILMGLHINRAVDNDR
jgi:uncharacterized ion transporter superfamily protein YfcC